MESIIYIFSISLQIAGAIMLIIRYWFKSVEAQVEVFQNNRTHVEEETLFLGGLEPSEKEFVKEIWQNRIAFAYITLGYIIGVWANTPSNKEASAIYIIILDVLFITFGIIASNKLSEKYENS